MNKPQRQKHKSGKVNFLQELRRSNAAQPIPSKKTREGKYGIKWEDYDDDDYSEYEWK